MEKTKAEQIAYHIRCVLFLMAQASIGDLGGEGNLEDARGKIERMREAQEIGQAPKEVLDFLDSAISWASKWERMNR